MKLVNRTRIAVERLITMDGGGREILLVLAKATYEARDAGPRLAEEQDPVQMADEYLGEPGESSIRIASDLALFKPAADVVMSGHAVPRSAGDNQVDVTLRVESLTKTVRVFGDREFRKGLVGYKVSAPQPIERVPLTWESAWGGADPEADPPSNCPENPVGTGYRAKRSKADFRGAPAPNIEQPGEPVKGPSPTGRPIGFGPIAPNWKPRVDRAGTYDDAWLEERMPLLPDDFDPRFNQIAPPDQVLDGYIEGGERVSVSGVSEAGEMAFVVPHDRPEAIVRLGPDRLTPDLACDALVIDADRARFSLVWRCTVPVHGRVEELQWVKVIHPLGPVEARDGA